MIRVGESKLIGRHFRNIFIVQNRNWWKDCPHSYNKDLDLVLTFDFALVHEITELGGTAAYLDHLGDPDEMERYNVETYRFFDTWYLNQDQKDIFSYKGLDFGNTLRLDIWNDVTYYVRIFLNLLIVRNLEYERIVAGVEDVNVLSVLDRLELCHDCWPKGDTTSLREFYFPTFRWMKENIRPQRFRQRLGALLFRILDFTFLWGDRLGLLRSAKADVFVDRYYPTVDIVERLKTDKRVNVVLPTYWKGKGLFHERRLPVTKPAQRHTKMATEMLSSFESKRSTTWEIEGFRISDILYGIISEKIAGALPHCFHIIEAITGFFETRNLRLYVLTANIGLVNGLMLEYCAKKNIPVYFIINGMMIHKFYFEQIYKMTWINSYGESIKKHYFRDSDNVICCGDPRMDRYIKEIAPKQTNYSEPTIIIGAGGFSNVDLNSYVAAEFDFFYDIMQALKILSIRGKKMKIVLKVRANGYMDQYEAFLKEYFPDLPVEVFDTIPFSQLIVRADFYMSIYSGTLFEASLLGIPALYYKKDTSLLNPPYDGKSELVTAFSIPDLVEKLELFYQQDPLFDAFKEKTVMEKYIGPLDGRNLQRNMDFINSRLFENDEVTGGSATTL